MPFVTPSSDATGAFEQLISLSGYAQIMFPPNQFPTPLPTTIAPSANWNSGLMIGDGFRNITIALQSTQAGSLVVQTYIDLAGTIARASPSTTAVVANTLLIVDLLANAATSPLLPFATYTVQISNSSGSTAATLTSFQMFLSSG